MRRVPWVRVGVSVGLGAVLTLGMAWVVPNLLAEGHRATRYGSMFGKPDSTIPVRIPPDRLGTLSKSGVWFEHRARYDPHRVLRSTEPILPRSIEDPGMPVWLNSAAVLTNTSEYVWNRRTGWPLRCFEATGVVQIQPGSGWGLVQTTSGHVEFALLGRTWAIPVSVRAVELMFNLTFWSIVGFLIAMLPEAVQRKLRARHGRCAACGYDLAGMTGQPCPECGRA